MKTLRLTICGILMLAMWACNAGPDIIPGAVLLGLKEADRLYVTEYVVHKIVTHDDIVRLKGQFLNNKIDLPLPIGNRKIAIPMDAYLKAYIDLSSLSENDIEVTTEPKTLKVTIPKPKVELTSTEIDFVGLKQFTSGFRFQYSDAEQSELVKQGRQIILNSMPQMGIAATAEQNAKDVLIPIFMQCGFTPDQITIEFK